MIFDQMPTLQAYQSANDYLEGRHFAVSVMKDPETSNHVLLVGNRTALSSPERLCILMQCFILFGT